MGALIYLQKISKKFSCCLFKETKHSRIGKSYQSDESVNIPFEEIFWICEFEATNAYFILNKVMFVVEKVLAETVF